MKEEKKTNEEEKRVVQQPRIRSEYSYLFEDNDEDPYEQIFRRVEEAEEPHIGGMPVDKDRAVDELFADPEELPEEKSVWSLTDALKKLPFLQRKPRPADTVPLPEEQLAEPADTEPGSAEIQTAASVPAETKAPESVVDEEPVEEDEPIIVFEPAKPKFTVTLPEEIPDVPKNTENKPKFTVTLPEDRPVIPETPKAIATEEIVNDDEPIIVFEPVRPKTGETPPAEMPETPKVIAAEEIVNDDEPIIVFEPVRLKTGEMPPAEMPTVPETPKIIATEEITDDEEPVIVFAPVGAKSEEELPADAPAESEENRSISEEAADGSAPADPPAEPETPARVEAEKEFLTAELVEDDELIFVFRTKKSAAVKPEEPAGVPVTAFEPEEPAEVPVTAFEPEEPAEVPVTAFEPEEEPAVEELPSWKVKVAIPEEIKDVEGKLKSIPVEELPISIFTEPAQAEKETPQPAADAAQEPAPAEETQGPAPETEPVPEAVPETEPEATEEVQPEPQEPAKPICVALPEETFRPHRGKEIVARSKERLYAPVEGAYRDLVAPIRKKKKQDIRRRNRMEKTAQLKQATAAKAVRVKDCTVACVKKTAYCLRPDVVYGGLKRIVTATAESGTYKISAILQLMAAGLGGLMLMALLIINRFDITTPVELSQHEVPVLFAQIHAIALGVVLLLSFRTMVGGTVSWFTRHCDRGTDGAVGLLSVICLTQSILSIFFYEEILQGRVSLYAPVCMLVLFMDAWGKLVNHRRVTRALRMLDDASGTECAGILQEDTELQARVDANIPDRLTAVRGQAADRAEFIRNAAYRDGSQKSVRTMIWPLLLAAVLIGVLAFTVDDSWMSALAACTATLCVCVPVSVSLCMTVPAMRGGKRMSKYGAAAASWESVACFGEVSCVVVRDEDLYPERTVKLVNVKVLKEKLLETAIVSAAAVLHQVGGPLCGVVNRILTGEVDTMPTAERVQADENGGAVGWVGGRRILIGKGELLQKYNLQAPSRDYENKICPEGRQLVYLASGNELVAVFILEYLADEELRQTIQALSDTGCDLAVCTADAVLTPAFLADRFGLDEEGVEVIRSTDRPAESGVEEEHRNRLLLTRGSLSLFAGLKTCIRMKGAMELASALQIAGILLGILLMVIFAATGAIYQVSNFVLTLFELFWLTAVLLIPAMKRM